MKKLLLAALLTVALAVPAFAGDSGVYAGIKVMDSYQSTGDISTSGRAGAFDTKSYSQNTFGGGIFLGYDFFKQHNTPIRAEVEFAMRSSVNTDYDLKRRFPGVSGANLKSEYNMHTIMANAYYDFHNDSPFTPYVGGGLGLAIINSKYEAEVFNNSGSSISDSYNTSNTALAYNLGVGCSYDFTDALTADFAYRFVGTSFHETDKSLGGTKFKVGMANYANEFSMGLRFNF
ncbi:MAG: outer membrane beta-barrel protein [Desulfovibrio sp.]|nr:outer membrane beta-barrel protein [Desulfovibrio sp.]